MKIFKNNIASIVKKSIDKQSRSLLCLSSLLLTTPALAGWEVTFIDKFEGNSIDWQNWTAQTDANFNNEVQCYTDDDSSVNKNFDVSDGTLKIIARKQQVNCAGLNNQSKSWTSGRINSKDKREFLYGRIESRIRFHNLEGGTWPAFWMLENRIAESPKKNDNDTIHWPNPGAGEIDVWEWFANSPSTYITNFFNTGGASCGNEVRYNYPNGASDVLAWHDYAVEWNENNISFYMDDTLVTSHDVSACPQYKEPMFVLLNVAMGGNLGGNIEANLNKATMEVDYLAHCTATNQNDATQCNESTPLIFSDDDNDGIANEVDKCPDTPQGEVTDTDGCPLGEDECLNDTSADCLPVVADIDNDGVTDDLDECDDTPEGSIVDLVGCLLELELEEKEDNIAPILTLTIKQNDVAVSTIDITSGIVVISAEAVDENSDDKLSFSWIIPGAIPAPTINNKTNKATVSFDPTSMTEGSVHTIDVTVSDSASPALSANATMQVSVKAGETTQFDEAIQDQADKKSAGAAFYLAILLLLIARCRKFQPLKVIRGK